MAQHGKAIILCVQLNIFAAFAYEGALRNVTLIILKLQEWCKIVIPIQASKMESSTFSQAILTLNSPSMPSSYLYLKRDPMRMKPDRAEFFCTGPLSLKKAWCSTAHFQRCLQALGWSILKTKVCSCSFPWEDVSGRTGQYSMYKTGRVTSLVLARVIIIWACGFPAGQCHTKIKYLLNIKVGCLHQYGLACRGIT